MAYGNFTYLSTGFDIVQYALMLNRTATISFLDSGNADQTAGDKAAQILNQEERELYVDNPALNLGTATVTVSAGTRTLTIPSAVYGADIDKLFYGVNNTPYDRQPIAIVNRDEGEDRPGFFLNTQIQSPYSGYAYWNRAHTELLLQNCVQQAQSYVITYRAKPTAWTAADLLYDDTPTVFSSIPTEHIKALQYRLAMQFALIQGYDKARERFDGQRRDAEAQLSQALTFNAAMWRSMKFHDKQFPVDQASPASPFVGLGSTGAT